MLLNLVKSSTQISSWFCLQPLSCGFNYEYQDAKQQGTTQLHVSFLCFSEPTAPLNVDIRTADEDSITVEWTEPNPAQGIITNYDIAYWKTADETLRQELADVGMATLFHRINDLELNVSYSIQVMSVLLCFEDNLKTSNPYIYKT